MLIINLKSYEETFGNQINLFLDPIKDILPNTKVDIYVAVNTVDIRMAKELYPHINIISQNVDSNKAGSSTGKVVPELLSNIGVSYSLFNHSENRKNFSTILEDIRNIQNRGIKLIVCCENVEEAKEILKAEPFAIAFEPPELICSGVSVSTYPDVVKNFIDLFKNTDTIPLVGAGISKGTDIKNSIELGAHGVLLASAYVKASDKKSKLQELLDGFVY